MDLVSCDWEEPVGHSVRELAPVNLICDVARHVFLSQHLEATLGYKEVLQRLLELDLLVPQLRTAFLGVEDLHVVSCGHFWRQLIDSFRLVQIFWQTFVIIIEHPPRLHQLNGSLVRQIRRSSLRSVVEDVDLETALIVIAHHYGCRDRYEIA